MSYIHILHICTHFYQCPYTELERHQKGNSHVKKLFYFEMRVEVQTALVLPRIIQILQQVIKFIQNYFYDVFFFLPIQVSKGMAHDFWMILK